MENNTDISSWWKQGAAKVNKNKRKSENSIIYTSDQSEKESDPIKNIINNEYGTHMFADSIIVKPKYHRTNKGWGNSMKAKEDKNKAQRDIKRLSVKMQEN